MGLLDDALNLIRGEDARKQANAAAEQQRMAEPVTCFTVDDEAAQLLREFVQAMRALGVKPSALYDVYHTKKRLYPGEHNIYICTHILRGWPVFPHGYAVTTDARMVGIENILTIQKDRVERSVRDGSRYRFEFRYRGFGRGLRVGAELIQLRPDPRSLGPDDIVARHDEMYDSGTPSFAVTLRDSLTQHLATLMR